jgi:hypothetical protein
LSAREAQSTRPATIAKIRYSVRCFIAWLAREHPGVGSFAEVTREQVLAYAASLEQAVSPRTQRPLSIESRLTRISDLSVFFHDTRREAGSASGSGMSAQRVEQLLAELGEPLTEEPSDPIH